MQTKQSFPASTLGRPATALYVASLTGLRTIPDRPAPVSPP